MKKFSTIVAVIAVLLIIAVSATLNYLFLSSTGKSAFESKVIGGVSVAADILKAVMPLFIVWAFLAQRWGYVWITGAGFALIATFSMTNAIGFMAQNRQEIVGVKEALTARHELASRELRDAEAKLAAIPRHRPAEAVAELMRGMEQDRRWLSSKQCTDATVPASQAFCSAYFTLRSEHAAALDATKLEPRLAQARAQVAALRDRGAGNEADPQASILAGFLGIDQGTVRSALVVFAALLIEVCSGIGLYWALGHTPAFWQAAHEIEPELRAPVAHPAVAATTLPAAIEAPPPPPVATVVNAAPPHPPTSGDMAAVAARAESEGAHEATPAPILPEPPRVELTIPPAPARTHAAPERDDDERHARPHFQDRRARQADLRNSLRKGAFRGTTNGDARDAVTPFPRHATANDGSIERRDQQEHAPPNDAAASRLEKLDA